MGKLDFKPGNMLYPLPAVMVSVRDKEGNDNIITVALSLIHIQMCIRDRDYVVFLDDLKLGDVNRSTRESIFYGGKGINVSTILNTLGLETTALGFVAGFTGKAIEDGRCV